MGTQMAHQPAGDYVERSTSGIEKQEKREKKRKSRHARDEKLRERKLQLIENIKAAQMVEDNVDDGEKPLEPMSTRKQHATTTAQQHITTTTTSKQHEHITTTAEPFTTATMTSSSGTQYIRMISSKPSSGDNTLSEIQLSLGCDRNTSQNWQPADCSYKYTKYSNLPHSITDYTPGGHCSLVTSSQQMDIDNRGAILPGELCHYTEDKHSDYKIRKKERSLSPLSSTRRAYLSVQKGGDVPHYGLYSAYTCYPVRRHSISSSHHRSADLSHDCSLDRHHKDQMNTLRKIELSRAVEQERQKRLHNEQIENEARRHSYYFLPSNSSPVSLTRYDMEVGRSRSLGRPARCKQIYGRALALYDFTAQTTREISFKKGDRILLIRQINADWMEGEHHGMVGILPVSYIQILLSIQEAHVLNTKEEGLAQTKYSFTAESSDEVSVKSGEYVFLLNRININWYRVRTERREGILPAAFLDVIKEPSHSARTSSPLTISPLTSLLSRQFHSQQSSPDHSLITSVSAPEGFDQSSRPVSSHFYSETEQNAYDKRIHDLCSIKDVLDLRDDVKTDSGLLSYEDESVKTDVSMKRRQSPIQLPSTMYEVVTPYTPVGIDELTLMQGDIIRVTDTFPDGWFVGISDLLHSCGMFPGHCVKAV